MQNSQVLKRLDVFERCFGNGGCFLDQGDFCGCDFANYAGGKRRPGKGYPVEHAGRQSQSCSDFAHPVLAQLDERLQNFVAEGFLRINAQLFKYIVLPFNTGDGFIHVGQNGALQQILGFALDDQLAKNVFVKGLRDGFSFFFGIGNSFKGGKKNLGRIHYCDLDPQLFKGSCHFRWFVFPHDTVVDDIGFQTIAQRLMAQGGDDSGIHAAGQSVDGQAVAHGFADFANLIVNKFSNIHMTCFYFFHFDHSGSFL